MLMVAWGQDIIWIKMKTLFLTAILWCILLVSKAQNLNTMENSQQDSLERAVYCNDGTNDAIDTAFAFPGATIIPVHFEGWSHYTETGEMLRQSFNALGIADRLKILKAGVKTEL